MIDHVSIGISDLAAGAAFYEAVLGTLGMTCLVRQESRAGFGKRYPEVWLNHRPGLPPHRLDAGTHICLRAPSEDAVRAFHRVALAHGGSDNGAPGPRQAAMTAYFAAFVRDSEGNCLEAAVFPRAPA